MPAPIAPAAIALLPDLPPARLALVVFAATYLLLAARRIGRIPLERSAIALAGGGLMVLAGVVTPEAAFRAVSLETLALLLGMMLLVALAQAAGFFGLAAWWLSVRFASERALLLAVLVTSALLSALVLNDAVVLLFTPILVQSLARRGIAPVTPGATSAAAGQRGGDPFPHLAALAIGANVGSLATPVGNPQNAFIAVTGNIGFGAFVGTLAPLALLLVGLAAAMLAPLVPSHKPHAPPPNVPPHDRRLLILAEVLAGGTFLAFILSDVTGLGLALTALAGGVAAALLAPAVARRRAVRGDGAAAADDGMARVQASTEPHSSAPAQGFSARDLYARVDWSILLLFAGLFVLMEALRTTAALEALQVAALTDTASLAGLGLFGGAVVVLSNVISNVPAVLLLAQPLAGDTAALLALAAFSTLAGCATLFGSAANLIVAEAAHQEGVAFPFLRFLKVGLPFTAAGFLVTLAWFLWVAG